MNTVRSYISDIYSEGGLDNIDQFLSARFTHNKIKKIIANFTAKDNNSNKLLAKIPEIWTEIVIPMEEVSVNTFVDLGSNCQQLMKSVYEIPSIYSSKFGAVIKNLSSLDFMRNYELCISPKIWRASQTQEYKSKKYFLWDGQFIYIPIPKGEQSSPQFVRMEAFFQDLFEVQKYNEKIGQVPKSCASAVDYNLPIPYYLQDDVNKTVLSQLGGIYLKVVRDQLPDNSAINKDNPNNP